MRAKVGKKLYLPILSYNIVVLKLLKHGMEQT